MKFSSLKAYLIYLVVLPVIGGGLGYLFSMFVGLTKGGVSDSVTTVSVISWGGVFLYAGARGAFNLYKLNKKVKAYKDANG
ncbi:hypothetical protein AKH09_10795 [Vibrio parahaemolyticus]|nr:hypothetical protein AKH09_10795 [Vibrio parahaemolyticus]